MRNMNTWSYAAVTQEAEWRVTDLMTNHANSEPKEAVTESSSFCPFSSQSGERS